MLMAKTTLLTKKQFSINIILIGLILIFFSFTWYWEFPYDTRTEKGLEFGFQHIAFSWIVILGLIIATILSFIKIYDDNEDKFKFANDKENENTTSVKTSNYFVIGLCILLGYFGYKFYSTSKFIYNNSIQYHNQYTQKVQEKQGFYDKLWKTYLQKEKITNLNKETFLKVTALIMENRRDGSTLAWKWVQENQNIPFEEFAVFYSDLSSFIEKQREGYFNIEKECQKIANSNNTLLDTLPNNLYNKVIGCKRIDFEYGFLSDKTSETFKTKKENIE